MNILIDDLPEEVAGIPIYTDYRNMIQFEMLINDPEIPNFEKACLAIDLLYREPISDFQKAWDGLLWYYRGGTEQEEISEENINRSSLKRAYDFEQDAGRIYTAFLQVYGIDLQENPLHWWSFLNMLMNLPDTCQMGKIMAWRSTDTSKLKGAEKKRVQELQKIFAIKRKSNHEKMTLMERDAQMIAKAQKRYKEAQEWANAKKSK